MSSIMLLLSLMAVYAPYDSIDKKRDAFLKATKPKEEIKSKVKSTLKQKANDQQEVTQLPEMEKTREIRSILKKHKKKRWHTRIKKQKNVSWADDQGKPLTEVREFKVAKKASADFKKVRLIMPGVMTDDPEAIAELLQCCGYDANDRLGDIKIDKSRIAFDIYPHGENICIPKVFNKWKMVAV